MLVVVTAQARKADNGRNLTSTDFFEKGRQSNRSSNLLRLDGEDSRGRNASGCRLDSPEGNKNTGDAQAAESEGEKQQQQQQR